jgi:hypothetical protein
MIPQGALLRVARSYEGQLEDPPGSNWGPVGNICRRSLEGLGIHEPASWCAAFVCLCVKEANGGTYPKGFVPSAGALELYEHNFAFRLHDLSFLQPEDVVIYDHGGGHGHVDIVEQTTLIVGKPMAFEVIGGNTNKSGGRQGIGVFGGIGRSLDDPKIKGALRLWAAPPALAVA